MEALRGLQRALAEASCLPSAATAAAAAAAEAAARRPSAATAAAAAAAAATVAAAVGGGGEAGVGGEVARLMQQGLGQGLGQGQGQGAQTAEAARQAAAALGTAGLLLSQHRWGGACVPRRACVHALRHVCVSVRVWGGRGCAFAF